MRFGLLANPIVYRNLGPVVPEAGESDGGIEAVLQYAVQEMRVDRIVICGHRGCAAVRRLHSSLAPGQDPAESPWLRHMRRAVARAVSRNHSDPRAGQAMEEALVRGQLEFLKDYAVLRERPSVQLHGWLYDSAASSIRRFCRERGTFINAVLPMLPPDSLQARTRRRPD
jgi:carbonic anhydrase